MTSGERTRKCSEAGDSLLRVARSLICPAPMSLRESHAKCCILRSRHFVYLRYVHVTACAALDLSRMSSWQLLRTLFSPLKKRSASARKNRQEKAQQKLLEEAQRAAEEHEREEALRLKRSAKKKEREEKAKVRRR